MSLMLPARVMCTVSDGAGGSCTISPLISASGSCAITDALGAYTLTASYSGDANYTVAPRHDR